MQRTYRSKKDTGGGLDHRDMLYNMDEKSSAFDAFYIQNIKQTKREQSCMGTSNNYGAASKRVRKRKIVKRLVKEVTPPPKHSFVDSLSGSVFLTPDKSLRVNKALDPFDQLLNSSPIWPEVKQPKKIDTFDKTLARTTKEAKTYDRKKKPVKKFNYSSYESSVSNKENSVTNTTQNITDVKAYELLVEKETATPKIDESINNIVKKLSAINYINNKNSNGSPNKTIKCNNNRLTENLHSPLTKTSPLSSTPFMDKTRSKSIYKFSPIPLADFSDSPKYVTIMEDENDVDKSIEEDGDCEVNKSIVFVIKTSSSKKRSQKEKSSDTNSSAKCKGNSTPLFSSEADSHDNVSDEVAKLPVNETPPEIRENNDLPCMNPSLLQISEMEPFIGFSNETIAKINNYIYNDDEKEKNLSIIIPKGKSFISKQKSKEKSMNGSNHDADIYSSMIEYSVQPEPFLGFSKQNDSIINISAADHSLPAQPFLECPEVENKSKDSDDDSSKSDYDLSKTDKSDKQFNDSVSLPKTMEEIDWTLMAENNEYLSQRRDSGKSLLYYSRNESFDEISEKSGDECGDKHSLYDTCCSVSSFTKEIKLNEPVVALERLNIEAFKTYQKDALCSEELTKAIKLNDPVVAIERINIEEFKKYQKDAFQSEELIKEIKLNNPVVALERINIETFKNYQKYALYSEEPLPPTTQRLSKGCSKKYYEKKPNQSEPKVALERIDMDLFYKYYEKMRNYAEGDEVESEEELSKAELSEDYASSIEESNYIVDDNDSDYIVLDDELSEENYDSTFAEQDITSVPSDTDAYSCGTSSSDSKRKSIKKEKCVSFVTTRRGKNLTNYLNIVVLDDSQESTGSECDKTVLSNHKNSPKEDVNNKFVDNNDENIVLDVEKTNLNEAGSPDTRLSNIVSKGSISKTEKCKILEESNSSKIIDISKNLDLKPGIILQPGKKWERSLSIYRRMTMNDHLDHSILEDEDLQTKGRMYRQSVINTMEMQGSLHNDSIHSRRSTFVSKPSRSTIRIVKETNNSRLSLSSTAVFDDLKGFLEDCDDTIVELSKLSLVDDHDVTVIEKFHEDRIATARDYVLRRCNQSDTVPFDECYPDPLLKNCRKIGEGVYGEVFLWRAPDGRARVMKVVPIAGQLRVNGERQKDFHEIIAEIVIAMELSALRAPISEIECHFEEGKDVESLDLHSVENATDVFNEVLAVRCVYGSYSSRLLDLWELYDETKGSENDNPAILPADQQYIVLELANAGQDLESYQFASADQAHALFLQVAFGLAVGEEAFQFEHRDLHWGNVLIAPTDQKFATFVVRGRAHRVARRGVAATIIDYSLSRLSLPLGVRERDADSAALYNDLAADDGLFGAVGDYQFEVYRLMRAKLGNDWKNFEPYTNILWLHYIADKMITALRYKRTATKCHKQYINKLKAIKQRILTYGSAVQFVLTDNEF